MKTLVFSGSGVLFPAHLGAAQRLYEASYHPDRLVGTSGGSIVAAYLSTGAEPKSAMRFVKESLPNDQLSLNWPFGLTRKWGLFNLEKMEKALEKHVPRLFRDAKIPLYVVTNDTATQREIVFSSSGSPTAPVAKAVVASSSIPVMFSPVRMDEHLLVDGGVVNMLAIDMFPEDSLGLRLMSDGEGSPTPPKNLFEYLLAVLGSMLTAMERQHIKDAVFSRVITIKLPWNGLNFWGFTKKTADMLYTHGYDAISRKISEGWSWGSSTRA